MFIDETWAKTNMARTHGWAPRGERLRMAVPHGHWNTTTFVAGITRHGMIAPFVLTGAIDRDAFEAYIKEVLVPELRPGDIVVMDNLSSHKGPKARKTIEDAGAQLLFLPPTAPTSIPSTSPSQSSRQGSDKPQREPSTVSGTPSAKSHKASHHKNAKTTSRRRIQPNMIGFRSKTLPLRPPLRFSLAARTARTTDLPLTQTPHRMHADYTYESTHASKYSHNISTILPFAWRPKFPGLL